MSNTGNTSWGNHPGNTTNRAQVIQLCSEIINRSRGDVNQSPWHTGANFPNNIVGPFPFNFPIELANITGNSALANEEGKTWTVGLVLKSPFDAPLLQNLTLAIDWYQVKISNAIAPTSAFSVYEKCLNRNGDNPTYDVNNQYCKLIARDQDGYRATVDTPFFNLGGIETSGIDVQLNWSFPVLAGRMSVTTEVNILDYYRDQVSPTDPFIDSTGTLRSGGQYDYKTFATVSYAQGKWSAGLRHRFLPSIDAIDKATNPNSPVRGAGGYGTLDAFGSFDLSQKLKLRGGIDNLTDRQPPRVGINPGVTAASGLTNAQFYDVLGRRYFLSLDMKL
jgi:iron complex outermembrane recepter protein